MKDFLVRNDYLSVLPEQNISTAFFFLEEFGIYLNYVRKLGFEETPDYDFLRELFAKVMKNNGDIDDGVFDWNRLNGTCSHSPFYPSIQYLYSIACRRARLGNDTWSKYNAVELRKVL